MMESASDKRNAEASKLEALLASAIDGIITIRRDGAVESVNPAAARLFGYDESEFLGRNVNFLMPEPFRSEHDGYVQNYLETGVKKVIGIGREVAGLRKDGSTFPMHLAVSQFEVEGAVFFTGIIHDLSERKEVERSFRQAQKMESIGQLTGGIAHDFNNLLTVIIGNLELLGMRLADEEDQDLVNEAQEAAELGSRLTSRLLAFARRSHLEAKVIDLNELSLGLTDILHRTLGETVRLSTSFSTNLWRTLADPTEVETAVINLAVNARDAMAEGGKLLLETENVSIDAAYAALEEGLEPGDYVRLSVSDTGSGMPEAVCARVFEPFFTTKETGKGTGLGLSMVYGFAKQSGGHVSIYSEVGKGTTINLYLPRHAEDAAAADKHTAFSPRPAAKSDLILVVEDDDRVRKLTLARLAELGYRTLEAADGPSALEVLDRNPDVDLVFSDLVMPGGLSGYDLCNEVQKRRPDVKVLLTSGYAEESVEPEKLASAGISLLRKPYRLSALAEAIDGALNG